MTARHPRANTAKAISRPKPVEQPVINQTGDADELEEAVDMMVLVLCWGDARTLAYSLVYKLAQVDRRKRYKSIAIQ